MADNLLPSNASPLERDMAGAAKAVNALPFDIQSVWSPTRCPVALLPWLAWSLSIDQWGSDWSDAQKRSAVASAIDDQRHKGTRLSVERVLARFDSLLYLVEWFEATPNLDPYTFEVRLPLIDGGGVVGGDRVTAEFARAIVRDVTSTKPVRAHFELVQELALSMPLGLVAAAQATGYRRLETDTVNAGDTTPWTDLIQDENGEPLEDDSGGTVDGSAP